LDDVLITIEVIHDHFADQVPPPITIRSAHGVNINQHSYSQKCAHTDGKKKPGCQPGFAVQSLEISPTIEFQFVFEMFSILPELTVDLCPILNRLVCVNDGAVIPSAKMKTNGFQ